MNTTDTTENENPVLFLDIDGVLHPQPCSDSLLFSRVPLLEAVLNDFLKACEWSNSMSVARAKRYISTAC